MNKATSTKTILYVDDDSDDHLFLRQFLLSTRSNALLVDAYDGDEAIRYLESVGLESLPSLIVLDLNMPRKNGHEVLAFLKNSSRYAEIPVVILSTSENIRDKETAEVLGAASYLQKPFSSNGYIDIVNKFNSFLRVA